MRKVIGIVGEGPTDYMVIKEVIDHITGECNEYRRLQPEPDMAGRFGNGWKGVWKWCETNSDVLDKVLHEVMPQLDLLVIQMDADVSRKEREVHCLCGSVECKVREESHPFRLYRDEAAIRSRRYQQTDWGFGSGRAAGENLPWVILGE